MRVLVTGATGFIGSYLTDRLLERGDHVAVVSRTPERVRATHTNCEPVAWLPDLSSYDAVVNLAGESLFGKRWSPAQRRLIEDSRVQATTRLVDALRDASPRPRVFVSASAIGYYGDCKDELLAEDHAPGSDFLSGVCSAWEQAARPAEELGVRTVHVRIGVVLGRGGGALQKMLLPFKLGAGGPIGSGRQWMSWIHLEDLSRLMLRAIGGEALQDDALRGAYNGTAPSPVTNKQFAQALGRVLRRPAFLPTPVFALRLALGDVASLLTDSQRCSADKLLAAGFEFTHPDLEPALAQLLRN